MAVMARERWTDERVDDLAVRMDKGFEEVKGEVRDVKGEVRHLRSEMGKGFERVDTDIRELRSDMSSMQRTMIIGFVTLFASIVASVIGGVFAVLAMG